MKKFLARLIAIIVIAGILLSCAPDLIDENGIHIPFITEKSNRRPGALSVAYGSKNVGFKNDVPEFFNIQRNNQMGYTV